MLAKNKDNELDAEAVMISQRHNLPGGYHSYDSPHPPPLCTVDGGPMFVDMDAVRNLLPLSNVSDTPGDDGSIGTKKAPCRVFDKELFWNGLVRAFTEGWKKVDVSIILNYVAMVTAKLVFPCW